MEAWEALLQAAGPAAPLSPAALEARVDGYRQRHLQRISGLQRLQEAEAGLQAALTRASEPLDAPRDPPGWQRALARLGLVELPPAPPPLADQIWRRQEAAMEQVRALGHHLDALERDLAILEEDSRQIGAEVRQASADALRATARHKALHAACGDAQAALAAEADGDRALRLAALADRLADAARAAHHDAQRFEATNARLAAVGDLLRQVRPALLQVQGSLQQLHAEGAAALDALTAKLTALASASAAYELGDALPVRALAERLQRLEALTEQSVLALDTGLDELGQRLSALDADAAARAAARAEVEAALRRVPRG